MPVTNLLKYGIKRGLGRGGISKRPHLSRRINCSNLRAGFASIHELGHLSKHCFARSSHSAEITQLRGPFGSGELCQNYNLAKSLCPETLFRLGNKKGFCREDPSLVLVTPSIPQHLPKVIAGKELSSLLVGDRAVLQEENEHRRRRDDAVFELLYGSGLRASELCGLTLDSVQLGERQVRVVGKGSKERIIPLSVPCIEKLKDYLEKSRCEFTQIASIEGHAESDKQANSERYAGSVKQAESDNSLFFNLAGKPLSPRDLRRIVRRRGHTHPHALRHTFATHLLDGGPTFAPSKSY